MYMIVSNMKNRINSKNIENDKSSSTTWNNKNILIGWKWTYCIHYMVQIYPWFKKEILKLNQAKYTKMYILY